MLERGKLTASYAPLTCTQLIHERQQYSDFSFCQAVKTTRGTHPLPVHQIYDIACQSSVKFAERVAHSEGLSWEDGVRLIALVGKWHLAGHVDGCFARHSLNFVRGVGNVSGEIVETNWSSLNSAAIMARVMSSGHRTEFLTRHLVDVNFKKMISMGELALHIFTVSN